MGKASLGFIFGVAVTCLVFVFIVREPETMLSELEGEAARASDLPVPESVSEGNRPDAIANEAEPDSEPGAVSVSVEGGIASVEELKTRRDEAYAAWARAGEEYREILAIEKWRSASLPEQPIFLPPEFDYLNEKPSEFHEQTQREAIDPIWSPTTETQIGNYFAERPGITDRYGNPTVNCRTTKCEIAFVAYGLDESVTEASMWNGIPIEFASELRFRNENAEIYDEAWAEQFGFVPNNENDVLMAIEVNVVDGVTTILWHLWK